MTKEEIILGFYENGELVAFARKNGHIEFFTCKPMNYTGLLDLFKTQYVPSDLGRDGSRNEIKKLVVSSAN